MYVLTDNQAMEILDELQKRSLITYLSLDRGKVVKYRIQDWKKHNTVLDYNCPCQKETGFFFMPVTTAMELVGAGKCSEMDIMLDLWLSFLKDPEDRELKHVDKTVDQAIETLKFIPAACLIFL